MADNTSQEDRSTARRVSRRRFVQAAGVTGAATGLSGCIYGGGGGGGGGGNTVRWGFDPTAAQENGDAIKEALHNNGLSDDITVEFVPGASDTGQRRTNYNRLLRAGESQPDMFLMDNGWVNVFIQNGLIQNLSDVLEDSMLSTVEDEYFTGFTATARDPGSGDLYGVPVFPDFPTMQYRKDWADQAGVSFSATEPISWAEWSRKTKQIQDEVGADMGFATQWDIYEGTSCCTFNEVLTSWGGAYFGDPTENLLGPVGDRPITVDQQPVVDGLKMMRRFVHGGGDSEALQDSDYAEEIAPTSITSWKEEDARSAILNGEAVMQRNWPYAIALNAAEEELGVEKYGAMPIPYGVTPDNATVPNTGGTASALGGWHMTVNPNSGKQDAIRQVISAAMSEEFQLTLLEVQGWLPPRPSLFESDRAQNVPVMGNYMETLKVAGQNVIARPVTSVWPDQSSKIASEANNAVSQSKTPSEAMTDLKSSLRSIENSA